MIKNTKLIAAIILILSSAILCGDILFSENLNQFLSHVIHCVVEGVIVLMFSKELRGQQE
ncbi:hypothetical protein UFOVP855_28 [uncultured Caudovirales phage]|jgi:hypothetical protein|uniref:Uncharacterized protein n=1 Tax=uncultured Caudovirales phage TaxID=2100421 RepID=A0A6J5T097_9CAUD|nr:hypothetical protein UFOVP527_5 [uncultured Caudovirales phage]CAB4167559.1 hypothetical protein UFOVP855_28 [uncultured Caudovirales phage]CAB4173605.1 hypothetical protein UFOVP954_46 [uncultured Caudovirales phage]CAB4178942.1 hypothetical protein UFOVP1026_15 [uncultured Caudovirales phage]CAB4188694.1 hypothetical protein UFOVP1180_52 [uncultured Caudovirales phage]